MSGFFEEVKRRKVYRVAVAYVVAAGGMIQLASAAFPAWELPNWALRLVIVLLLIGFPIALILAWAFDVTPEGIRATEPLPSLSSHRRGRRNLALLLLLALLISGTAGLFLLPRASAHKMDKSIAVLPFENLSDDKENAYFADGIQDDILTNLARIGDLKVVSRTSVLMYRGKPGSVRDIGKALGVSAILEGTVRKSGNRVRINVQLINAENDEHLWAQEYDRDLTDVFAIQTDLSQKIAGELRAKLSPGEMAQMSRRPTENSEAQLYYMQAHDLQSHVDDIAKLKQAEHFYERALQADGNFALAAAGSSQLQSWIMHTYDATPARREKAQQLAMHALELQPDLPEAHLARGFAYYYGENDFDSALKEFEIARQGLPNSNEVYLAIGAIQRRKGHWAESNASLEKAAELNPRESWALQNLATNYEMARDFPAARQTIDRALAIDPNSFTLASIKVKIAMLENGDLSGADAILAHFEQTPRDHPEWYFFCAERGGLRLLQRKYEEALQSAQLAPDEELMGRLGFLPSKYMILGAAYQGLHRDEEARAAFSKARDLAQNRVNTAPLDPDSHLLLAGALASLEEKEAALAETQRALDLFPVSKDAFHGPDILEGAAEIYAQVDEADRAFAALDQLSKIPSPQSAALLKLHPVWDKIRNDPRFEPTVQKFSAKI